MTKKTRIRVARVAAGAVIAAGASLTIAGAAQAAGIGVDVAGVSVDVGLTGIGDDPTDTPTVPPTEIPDPPTEEPPTEEPPTEEPPTEEPPTEEPPTEEPPTEEPPTEEPPTEEPTGDPTEEPSGTPTKPGEGGATGGNGGGSGDDEGAGTCTVDLDGAECVDNTDTDSAGSQPVQQGSAKEELAETGAAETSFLLIGAATMIAGGIGFRMLPRLVGGGRTVA
ncbi:LPXTG cell wall anchor domain-containing protein [Streptomyces odonnellii]|uniref:LPXTG cell wall anchor domain-containing protein n=1 Tax=Streptomyces odonnellii TaxID=1417980 RepID=UPI000626A62D|nr:LPXTG cell wall anchor domain-containing protein [Streptomyces odonnellii]